MSELKAHRIDNIISAYKIGKAFCMKTEEEVYIKSEADKVIAELKADYKEACYRLQTANLIKDEQLAATRHSKHKRCLAMAERCKYRMYYLAAVVEQETSKIIPLKAQIQRYEKRERRMDYWKNRWLELAEKFKPNKQTAQQGKGKQYA